jgi:hypothetical protein
MCAKTSGERVAAIRSVCAACRKVPAEPVVSPKALARISRSALSIAARSKPRLLRST